MTNEEAEELRKKLSAHYHDQVLTVGEFCNIFRQWAEVAGSYLVSRGYIHSVDNIPTIFLAASKSSLLGRMIYGREKIRTEQCPVHKGSWSGLFVDCPCSGCGWLPNEKKDD